MNYFCVTGNQEELQQLILLLKKEFADASGGIKRQITVYLDRDWWWTRPSNEPNTLTYQLPQDQETVYQLLNLPLPTPMLKIGDKVEFPTMSFAAKDRAADQGQQYLYISSISSNPIHSKYGVVLSDTPDGSGNYFKLDKLVAYQETEDKMKDVIEVGDIVNGRTAIGVTVTKIEGDVYRYQDDTGGIHKSFVKLVRKGPKKEIIGYELLKDLPGIPTGSKTTDHKTMSTGGVVFKGGETSITIPNNRLQDTTWFKPLYKPTEVTVSISGNRTVVIKDGEALIKNVGAVPLAAVEELAKIFTKTKNIGGFSARVTDGTVALGCQSFTMEDIQAVFQALTNLK